MNALGALFTIGPVVNNALGDLFTIGPVVNNALGALGGLSGLQWPWWSSIGRPNCGGLKPFGVQLFSVHIDPFPVVMVVFRISF